MLLQCYSKPAGLEVLLECEKEGLKPINSPSYSAIMEGLSLLVPYISTPDSVDGNVILLSTSNV